MPGFTWTWDADTGTHKNHEISRRLWRAATEESVCMDYVRPVEGFGRKQGETVTLMRLSAMTEPSSGTLTEGVRIPEDSYAISSTTITVSEYGRAVPYTSLAEDLSIFNVENEIQQALRNQMQRTLDTVIANSMQSTLVKYVPTGVASSTITTNGTAGAAASANMNLYHVEQISDYLYDTLLCPPWAGDDYVGIFRTLALRGIKQDPAWEEWHKYTNPGAKQNGEVGRIERVRFVQTNHNNAFGKIGTSSVLGEGVVFGRDFVAMAEVQTPELRAGIPADFGRSKAVAWYGILGFALIWNTANAGQCKGIHVSST